MESDDVTTVSVGLDLNPFAGLDDPWELLNKVRALDLQERQQHLDMWLGLVARRPGHERDALVAQGREVWHYRMETARAGLREMEDVVRGISRVAACMATDDILAESVYRPGTEQEIGYLIYDFNKPEDPPVWQEKLELGKTVFFPPGSKLMETGTILLPSGVEEYGTDYDLYLRIRSHVMKYMRIENAPFRTLACCYILMSWMFDRFDAIPYLRAQGDLGTGKSRLLQVIGSLCYRPVMAGGATTASPIFRIIDRFHGSLVIDEADFGKSDLWDEIVKILNVGYQRGFPVLRSERDGGSEQFDVRAYDCVPTGTLISAERGLVPIEQLKLGDMVLTRSGYRAVTRSMYLGVRKTLRVRTSLGSVICTPDHPFVVTREGRWQKVFAEHLVPGDLLHPVRAVLPGARTELPLAPVVRCGQRQSVTTPTLDAELAWFLGYFHGDGCVSSRGQVRVSCADVTVTRRVVQQLKRFGVRVHVYKSPRCSTVAVSSRALAAYLGQWKQLYTAIRVPDFILQGIPEIRAAYLAGVLDADGSISRDVVIGACTVYEAFAQDLQALYASLGVLARVVVVRPAGRLVATPGNAPRPTKNSLWALTLRRYEVEQARAWLTPQMVKGLPRVKIVKDPRGGGKRSHTRALEPPLVCVTEVTSAPSTAVWDITVEDQHEFVINGLAVGNCYSPKLLATRRRFNDAALESRCLSHTMPLLQELPKDVPLVLGPQFRAEALRLRNMLLLWRYRHYNKVAVDPTERMAGIEPRVNQIVQPLMACAEDSRLKETIRSMMVEYSAKVQAERRESLEGQTVGALLSTWLRRSKTDRLLMKSVTEVLRNDYEQATITDRKVGDVIRRVLGVQVQSIGGMAWVRMTDEDAKRLSMRYGVNLSEYGGGSANV